MDVESVVAELKLTPKGRLVYGKDWDRNEGDISFILNNSDSDLIEQYIKLSPSPNKDIHLGRKHGEKEFSSKEEGCESPINSILKAGTSEKNNSMSPRKLLPQNLHIISPISSYNNSLLKEIDKEFDSLLKSKNKMRVQNFKANLLMIDSEFAQSLEEIERKNLDRLNNKSNQLHVEQIHLGNENNEELDNFQQLKKAREDIVEEKVRQAALYRKDLEKKLKKVEEQKKKRFEQKKTLGLLAQKACEILSDVTKIYNESKQNTPKLPQNFQLLFDESSDIFLKCSELISRGVDSDSFNLDYYIEEATDLIEEFMKIKGKCHEFSEKIKQDKIKEEQQKIQKEKEDAERKKSEEAAKAAQNQAPSSANKQHNELVISTNQVLETGISISSAYPALAPLESVLKTLLIQVSSKEAFICYLKLVKNQTDFSKSFDEFNKSTDKVKKTFKFDLYKVVNTCINAISDESPKHLLDKVIKLSSLVRNGTVEHGNKKISCKGDTMAVGLCKDLIARKLTLQAESQVASNFKTVFPIASVAIGMWCLQPDIGELLLAHIYIKCPYLVPFYIPKIKTMSTADYCRLVGYKVDGDEIEAEDKHLNKLSGFIRLFAAIISSDIPPQLGKKNHPFGIDNGWVWFTRLLNLEPQPTVTATIIYDFLEVAGHTMMKSYGKQFQKLLLFLCNEFMPKIINITDPKSKASAMRLKLFLDDCIKQGHIKQPEGFLAPQWWRM